LAYLAVYFFSKVASAAEAISDEDRLIGSFDAGRRHENYR